MPTGFQFKNSSPAQNTQNRLDEYFMPMAHKAVQISLMPKTPQCHEPKPGEVACYGQDTEVDGYI